MYPVIRSATKRMVRRCMGQLSHSVDRETGVIRIVGEGIYTLSQATEHFERLAETVSRIRAKRGQVKVLIDTSKGAVQPPDVFNKIQESAKVIYRADDRIALVVASTLHKFQMRRVIDPFCTNLFVSEKAALTWLCAYDHAASLLSDERQAR